MNEVGRHGFLELKTTQFKPLTKSRNSTRSFPTWDRPATAAECLHQILVFEFGPPIISTRGAPASGRGDIHIYFPGLWRWHCGLLLPALSTVLIWWGNYWRILVTLLSPSPAPGLALLKMNSSEQNILWSVQQNPEGPWLLTTLYCY